MARTLKSYIREHLVFGTGSRRREEHIVLLRKIIFSGEANQDFVDLMAWLEFRVCDECSGLYEEFKKEKQ